MSRQRIKRREWRKLVTGLRSKAAAEEVVDKLRASRAFGRGPFRVVVAREHRGWDVEGREGLDAPRRATIALSPPPPTPTQEVET